MICRAARCYRVLSIASPGVNYTRCYLLRFLVLCCYTVTLCYLSPRMALRLLTIQGLVNRVARCYMVLSVASSGVTGCYPSRRPVLQGVICRVARCYRVLSVASPGVTRCYLSRRPVLYRVLSVASPGVAGCYLSRRRCYTGCYLSRRPVLQGVICRVARCYRVFELSCSCLLAQHVVYLFMASRVMVPANIVW